MSQTWIRGSLKEPVVLKGFIRLNTRPPQDPTLLLWEQETDLEDVTFVEIPTTDNRIVNYMPSLRRSRLIEKRIRTTNRNRSPRTPIRGKHTWPKLSKSSIRTRNDTKRRTL